MLYLLLSMFKTVKVNSRIKCGNSNHCPRTFLQKAGEKFSVANKLNGLNFAIELIHRVQKSLPLRKVWSHFNFWTVMLYTFKHTSTSNMLLSKSCQNIKNVVHSMFLISHFAIMELRCQHGKSQTVPRVTYKIKITEPNEV
jgi:hypothetical protein